MRPARAAPRWLPPMPPGHWPAWGWRDVPRTAIVTAERPLQTLALGREEFRTAVTGIPQAWRPPMPWRHGGCPRTRPAAATDPPAPDLSATRHNRVFCCQRTEIGYVLTRRVTMLRTPAGSARQK